MNNYGFIRVAAAVPVVKLGNISGNTQTIIQLIDEAISKEVSLLTFPELCITGYTCSDMFGFDNLISNAEQSIEQICNHLVDKDICVVVGAPVKYLGRLYNCGIVIKGGRIYGIVPKIHLPNYEEFYEARWFTSGKDFTIAENIKYAGQDSKISPYQLFSTNDFSFAVEICEDLWTAIPPSSYHCLCGAEIIVNLSASNEIAMKHEYRKQLVAQQSARTNSAYIYCSAGFGESSQDLVYAGAAIIAENGTIVSENERFKIESSLIISDIDTEKLRHLRRKRTTFNAVSPDGTDNSHWKKIYTKHFLGESSKSDFEKTFYRYVEPHPFAPTMSKEDFFKRCEEIVSIQVTGLARRLSHINCQTAVIGISGGLDSTLALVITAIAFDKLAWDRKRIIGVTMPGFGTTNRTKNNATDLMDALGISSREISIKKACEQHFEDIGHDSSIHDVTYENSQARERTQILMDIANQSNGIVVGTGDLSELALGWATYNGDHMSMYAVNASIPKTLVKHLVKWTADTHFGKPVGSNKDIDFGKDINADKDVDLEKYIDSDKDTVLNRSVSDILYDIIDTPISPELLPADECGEISQITEDLVGPYELHDFFLYNFFRTGAGPKKILFLAKKAFLQKSVEGIITKESTKSTTIKANTEEITAKVNTKEITTDASCGVYTEEIIEKWLRTFVRRFFNQQFKRSCLPDSPKVGSVTLSPRGDWRMPSDMSSDDFLAELEA